MLDASGNLRAVDDNGDELATAAGQAAIVAYLDTEVQDIIDTLGTPAGASIAADSANKTGYSLAATGLDAIADPDDLTPATVPTTFTQKLRWLIQWFWKGAKTPTAITVKNEAGQTITTQQITDDGASNETLGAPQ